MSRISRIMNSQNQVVRELIPGKMGMASGIEHRRNTNANCQVEEIQFGTVYMIFHVPWKSMCIPTLAPWEDP